jgi:hypothetical protein
MSELQDRWILKDPNSLEGDGSDNLRVKVDSSNAIERSANGLIIKSEGITNAQLAGNIENSKLVETYIQANGSIVFTAAQPMGGFKLTGLADGTSDQDAVTKAQLDNAVLGLRWLDAPARAISTLNITLSGTQIIDGVTLIVDDRILVAGQTSAIQNGIYKVAVGAWIRTEDLITGSKAQNKTLFVSEGSVYADTAWTCTNDNGSDIVNTNELNWSQFSGSSIIAGDGIDKTGNTISVNITDIIGNGLTESGNNILVLAEDVSILVGSSGIKVNSYWGLELDNTNGLRVNDYIGITVDANGVSVKAYNGITVDTNGVSVNVGNGLTNTGGSGTAIALTTLTSNWDIGSTGTITGIKNPINDSDAVNKLWVENQISSASTIRTVEIFILDATNITNKYVTLNSIPETANDTIIIIKGAPNQDYGTDFQMDGTTTDRLSWDGLGLDGILRVNDKLTVTYSA